MTKMTKYMVGTMDETVPPHCVNADILDALGPDATEDDSLGFAHEIACQLYGQVNADAFLID